MQTEGSNVLWEIQPQPHSDGVDFAFHSGASVELISQFAHEQEVLFAPGTLIRATDAEAPEKQKGGVSFEAEAEGSGAGPRFQAVTMIPSVF